MDIPQQFPVHWGWIKRIFFDFDVDFDFWYLICDVIYAAPATHEWYKMPAAAFQHRDDVYLHFVIRVRLHQQFRILARCSQESIWCHEQAMNFMRRRRAVSYRVTYLL
jgi:hypothetical protein